MCFKLMTASLSIYIYRLLYMNPMVITNSNPKIDMQNQRKMNTNTAKENYQTSKEIKIKIKQEK